MIQLIIGGARSGKSQYAQSLLATARAVTGIFTAQALDAEMQARIARHQRDRPLHWQVLEQPLHLAQALAALRGQQVLVDCLSLWLSNALHQNTWPEERDTLLNELSHWQTEGQLLLVSNEVGSGIVPLGALSRQFVDEQGWLNQACAQLSQQVWLVVAGLPLSIKTP